MTRLRAFLLGVAVGALGLLFVLAQWAAVGR